MPSNSGPGWVEFLCAICVDLPADPDGVSDSMTRILMRIAGVDK
ncbi:hypothetical protein ACF1AY_35580 [Streptomyces sp. NPDC014776]